jgi:hypothetical protein
LAQDAGDGRIGFPISSPGVLAAFVPHGAKSDTVRQIVEIRVEGLVERRCMMIGPRSMTNQVPSPRLRFHA